MKECDNCSGHVDRCEDCDHRDECECYAWLEEV